MANTSSTYGLRPVRKIDGSPFINAQNRYRIATSESTAILILLLANQLGVIITLVQLQRVTLWHSLLTTRV